MDIICCKTLGYETCVETLAEVWGGGGHAPSHLYKEGNYIRGWDVNKCLNCLTAAISVFTLI